MTTVNVDRMRRYRERTPSSDAYSRARARFDLPVTFTSGMYSVWNLALFSEEQRWEMFSQTLANRGFALARFVAEAYVKKGGMEPWQARVFVADYARAKGHLPTP